MTTDQAPAFDAATLAQIEAIVEHVNANHADAVLFVARHLARRDGGTATVTDAELGAVDPLGAEVVLTTTGGPAVARLVFDAPASSGHDLQGAFLAAMAAARSDAAPEEPLTSIERELAATATLTTRLGHIARREAITPNVLQLTVGGLDGLTSEGGDEFWFVLATRDGSPFPEDWTMADYRDRAEDNPIVGAYYTTRAVRPEAGELDLWVVLHEHDEGAAHLLSQAPLGDTVAVWGPRHSFRIPAGADSLLLIADESGTAAAAGLIEAAPSGMSITAVLEAVDADHELPLPPHPGLRVRWVHRGGDAPGGPTNRLLDAVRQECGGWTPSAAFGAAESRQISAVRRYVRNELGLASTAVLMTGYWRREHA